MFFDYSGIVNIVQIRYRYDSRFNNFPIERVNKVNSVPRKGHLFTLFTLQMGKVLNRGS